MRLDGCGWAEAKQLLQSSQKELIVSHRLNAHDRRELQALGLNTKLCTISVRLIKAADKTHWVEMGRCYERFALQATALGIRNAFVNQLIEMAETRPDFASAMGLAGQRPDLVVRFGRGAAMPQSLRRSVSAVQV